MVLVSFSNLRTGAFVSGYAGLPVSGLLESGEKLSEDSMAPIPHSLIL